MLTCIFSVARDQTQHYFSLNSGCTPGVPGTVLFPSSSATKLERVTTFYIYIYLKTMETHIGLAKASSSVPTLSVPCHDPTGSWRVPAVMCKGRSTPLTSSVQSLSWNSFSDLWTHWLVFVVFFGKPFGTFPFTSGLHKPQFVRNWGQKKFIAY